MLLAGRMQNAGLMLNVSRARTPTHRVCGKPRSPSEVADDGHVEVEQMAVLEQTAALEQMAPCDGKPASAEVAWSPPGSDRDNTAR
jgi:hypothetical protein